VGGKLEYSVIANGTYSVVMCVLLKNLAHHFALYKIIGVFIFLSVSLCFFLTVSQKVLNKALLPVRYVLNNQYFHQLRGQLFEIMCTFDSWKTMCYG
jgi:Na+-translocating ferredoxin:NAD+ oxidoreductase RnfE subunit